MEIVKIKLKNCSFCKKKIPVGEMVIVGMSCVHQECLDDFIQSKLNKVRKKKLTIKNSFKNIKDESKKAKAKHTAWVVFSKYIRLRDSYMKNGERLCKCISCGRERKMDGGLIHAGHYIPKSKGDYFYFNEDNVWCQCMNCNNFGSHDTGANYRKNLVKKIGLERVEALEKAKNKVVRYTLEDYRAISKKYNKLFKELKK